AHAFLGLDAVLTGVVEHEQVELAPHDLPGLRALVRLVVPEIERCRQLALGVDELHAELLDEVALLHLFKHVEALEHPVGFGNERLADVETRKMLALEKTHLVALLGDERRDGATRWPAADDDDVGLRMVDHSCFLSWVHLAAALAPRVCLPRLTLSA